MSVWTSIDATRASDGAQVFIKRVILKTRPNPAVCTELELNELLLSEGFADDHDNPCLPLLDQFTEQNARGAQVFGDVVFMVFPLCLKARILPCRVALHALDLFYQVLQVH